MGIRSSSSGCARMVIQQEPPLLYHGMATSAAIIVAKRCWQVPARGGASSAAWSCAIHVAHLLTQVMQSRQILNGVSKNTSQAPRGLRKLVETSRSIATCRFRPEWNKSHSREHCIAQSCGPCRRRTTATNNNQLQPTTTSNQQPPTTTNNHQQGAAFIAAKAAGRSGCNVGADAAAVDINVIRAAGVAGYAPPPLLRITP